MPKKFKLKKGDEVIVTAGRSKGHSGKIKKVITSKDRVLVEGVNMVQRRVKPAAHAPEGIINKEASIHISNVAYSDSSQKKPTKIGFKFDTEGRKYRFAKLSDEKIV